MKKQKKKKLVECLLELVVGLLGVGSKDGIKIDSASRIEYRRENRPRDVMVKFAC